MSTHQQAPPTNCATARQQDTSLPFLKERLDIQSTNNMQTSTIFLTLLASATPLYAEYVSIQAYSDNNCQKTEGGPFSVSSSQCFKLGGALSSFKIVAGDLEGKAVTAYSSGSCGKGQQHGFNSNDRSCLIPGFDTYALGTDF